MLAANIALRAITLMGTGFTGLYGQDAYAYDIFAQDILAFWRGEGALGAFFWPLGYPLLLAFGYTLSGSDWTVGLLINIALGSALAPLTYGLTHRLTNDRRSALISGLVMTTCGQALQSSVVIMADIPALFWATASIFSLWVALETERRHWLIASAALLAIASITRWLCLILWPAWLLTIIAQRKSIPRPTFFSAVVCAGLVFLPQALFSLHNPYPTLNHEWVTGWSLENIFRNQFSNVDGTFRYEQTNFSFYGRVFYDAPYLNPLLTPLLIIGIARLVTQPAPLRHRIITYWAILPALFLMGIPYQNIRFPLLCFTAVACLVGVGHHAIGSRIATIRPLWAIISGTLIIGIVANGQTALSATQAFIATQLRDQSAVAWAEQILPAGAPVFTSGLTLALAHDSEFIVYELYYETPHTLKAKLAPLNEAFVIVNVWQIRHQWAGRELEQVYDWLIAHGMRPFSRHGNYTFFRIGS